MKPELVVSGGHITTTAGKLTAKEAVDYIKQLKKAIKEVKAKYCPQGHLMDKDNCRVVVLATGYKVRLCRVCRAEYDEKYYEENYKSVTKRAREYYHREKANARASTE
jgi:hypothetical protein